MNSKQQRILKSVFTDPVPSNILWSDIESLLKALGATLQEGNGSRVRVTLNGARAVFHEPHPEKETNKGAVKSVREFLINAGIDYKEEASNADL